MSSISAGAMLLSMQSDFVTSKKSLLVPYSHSLLLAKHMDSMLVHSDDLSSSQSGTKSLLHINVWLILDEGPDALPPH